MWYDANKCDEVRKKEKDVVKSTMEGGVKYITNLNGMGN